VLALRYVYVLALALWLGGMVVLGAVVAPVLSGVVFGAILSRFHYIAYGAGTLALVSLAAMALLGPRPRAFAARSAIVGVMLLIALYSGFVALRVEELHQLSTRLMMANIIGALVLLYWEAKEQ